MTLPAGAVLVADCLVTNSTPLIVLAKIGHLDLLTAFAPAVLVPQTVAEEVLAGNDTDPARMALQARWGQVIADVPLPPALASLRLDPGEAAVLALSLTLPAAAAVLDDGKARAAARLLGVACIGTLGLIARARVAGRIEQAEPLFAALQAIGFRADDALLSDILRGLGEDIL